MSAAKLEQVENKITEWSDERLQQLMDSTFTHHKDELLLALIGAIASLLFGPVLMIWFDGAKSKAIGVICILAGIIGICVYLVKMPKKGFKDQSEYAKAALQKNPTSLVWAYVLIEKEEHSRVHYWMLNFRNGMCVKIPQALINKDVREYLHERNIQGFTGALKRLNPNLVIGYSDEVKKMYLGGLL